MIVRSPRTRSPRSPPSISYPLPFDYSTQSPTSPTISTIQMPTHGHSHSLGHSRKPSVTNPMTWLSRNNNPSPPKSRPYSPSKPVRISEPKFSNLFDAVNHPRSGPLGSGATVVKTPHEALCGTTVHLTHEGVEKFEPTLEEDESSFADALEHEQVLDVKQVLDPNPLQSPPLPPVPLSPVLIFETGRPASKQRPPLPPPLTTTMPNPQPIHTQPRPSLKTRSPPNSEYCPPLPSHIFTSPPQPRFEAILISPLPTHAIDSSKIIVSLETGTATHRTTLGTLTSRPSHIASYLKSLLPASNPDRDSTAMPSPTTPDSTFNSVFHNHLAASGLLAPSAAIHIFLDRPSDPYAHILSYLRTAPSAPEFSPALPHAIQLMTTSSRRLEALLALRDEARYLGLDELYKLCVDEIRQRHEHAVRKRGSSSSRGSSSVAASQHSSNTLRDPVDQEAHFVYRDSSETKSVHARLSDPEQRSAPVPPVPSSPIMNRRRSQSLVNMFTPPPSGWI